MMTLRSCRAADYDMSVLHRFISGRYLPQSSQSVEWLTEERRVESDFYFYFFEIYIYTYIYDIYISYFSHEIIFSVSYHSMMFLRKRKQQMKSTCFDNKIIDGFSK